MSLYDTFMALKDGQAVYWEYLVHHDEKLPVVSYKVGNDLVSEYYFGNACAYSRTIVPKAFEGDWLKRRLDSVTVTHFELLG